MRQSKQRRNGVPKPAVELWLQALPPAGFLAHPWFTSHLQALHPPKRDMEDPLLPPCARLSARLQSHQGQAVTSLSGSEQKDLNVTRKIPQSGINHLLGAASRQ